MEHLSSFLRINIEIAKSSNWVGVAGCIVSIIFGFPLIKYTKTQGRSLGAITKQQDIENFNYFGNGPITCQWRKGGTKVIGVRSDNGGK